MKNFLLTTVLIFFTIIIMMFSVRGKFDGTIQYQSGLSTVVGGPYEASNSTSRYALVKSIADDHSFFLSDELASFASPDLVHYNDKYFTIFTPGVSFLTVPLYQLGSKVGLPQLISYLLNPIMGIICLLLIINLSKKFGANKIAATIAGFTFLFATNALGYSQTLTQHLSSSVLILTCLLLATAKPNGLRNILFGACVGFSLLIDIPNIFLCIPLTMYMLSKHIEMIKKKDSNTLSIKLIVIYLAIGLLPFLGLFAWYNKELTGSYTKIGQTIGRSDYGKDVVAIDGPEKSIYESKLALDTRLLLNGAYILLTSDERGILYYEPIILIGILGLIIAFKNQSDKALSNAVIGTIIINILLYGMFGDPWGGWSFGPRYLIPTSAILCIFVGVAVSKLSRKILFNILVLSLTLYSIYINTLGVTTTNNIPPKNEALNLITRIPYTYQYNIDQLKSVGTSSLAYDMYLKAYFSPTTFFHYYAGSISFLMLFLYTQLYIYNRKNKSI